MMVEVRREEFLELRGNICSWESQSAFCLSRCLNGPPALKGCGRCSDVEILSPQASMIVNWTGNTLLFHLALGLRLGQYPWT